MQPMAEGERKESQVRFQGFSKVHTFSLSPPPSNKTSVQTVPHMDGMSAAILSGLEESWYSQRLAQHEDTRKSMRTT